MNYITGYISFFSTHLTFRPVQRSGNQLRRGDGTIGSILLYNMIER